MTRSSYSPIEQKIIYVPYRSKLCSSTSLKLSWLLITCIPIGAIAQQSYSYSSFGTPGLIDMPTADSAEDAELAATVSHFAGSTRTTLTFQITPRLSGSFRYSKIENGPGSSGALYDRSFDLRYRLLDETRFRPAVAVGLQDFIGTGVYSGEYLVASKAIHPRLRVTGGLGWGRFGSYNGFTNPLGAIDDRFKTRPSGFTGTGGQIESARWFRGDAAFFGGVSWQASDRLVLKAEYSSDAYARETGQGLFERDTPFNFGLDYKLRDNLHVQAYYMHGSEIGVAFNVLANPRKIGVDGSRNKAPTPVARRNPGSFQDTDWVTSADKNGRIQTDTAQGLAAEGMVLEAIDVEATQATIHLRNDPYLARAEAIGRAARVLTRTLPASIERFIIVPVERGVPLAAVHLSRTDLEELEYEPEGAWLSYARAEIRDAAGTLENSSYTPGLYPTFNWSVGPYLNASYFDPDEPVRLDGGVQLRGRYDIAPGWLLSGTVRHRLAGNIGDATRAANSPLPRVRSEAYLYAREGETALSDLTIAHYFRPGQDLYGRVTAGYLENMFGGVSSELLWKPVESRLALGAEISYVKQRDFDQAFGFRDYSVATGHLSAYYDFGNGFHGQIDTGRYLAGDWGATFTVDRTFKNGWNVGAYATFTDVSFDDFGEGSFDKGLRLTVPLTKILGGPTDETYDTVIQPIVRDGGARLDVAGRLYDTVKSYHGQGLKNSWGRFWR
jgi:hypothetical protein